MDRINGTIKSEKIVSIFDAFLVATLDRVATKV